MFPKSDGLEWLEADGLGGFASGTATGVQTRRYHAWLLTASTPPTGRLVLVNSAEVWVRTANGTWPLSTHVYSPGVRHPAGDRFLKAFSTDPWPVWDFEFPDGLHLRQELFVPHGTSSVVVQWSATQANGDVELGVRPLFSGRDYHATHHENSQFHFEPVAGDSQWTWRPYEGIPEVRIVANGEYHHSPCWYRQFLYVREQERGLEAREDLASPGEFRFPLHAGSSVMIFESRTPQSGSMVAPTSAVDAANQLRTIETNRRSRFRSRLERGADAYLVRRGDGCTIIAGYPWFTDWGRDTFIAMRGLCLATGRLDEAKAILLAWADTLSEGMLPNRFPDQGTQPEYNSVDASLWFVIVVHEFLAAANTARLTVTPLERERLADAVSAILDGYQRGTRFGIEADDDGLLRCGEPGTQLTWMDVKIGDQPVTPRCGKPVEVNALWLNALALSSEESPRWRTAFERGREAFRERFWNSGQRGLFDVIDVDHVEDQNDESLRPNQVFAVGGLPVQLLEGDPARAVVSALESELLTPVGLRTLSPQEAGYMGQCAGAPTERDRAYHQGTVWPWLLGPFVEAWLRVNGDSRKQRETARSRFLEPLLAATKASEIGHVPEIADGDAPHAFRGCPFQAWSLGELLRIERMLSIEKDQVPQAKPRPARNGQKTDTH